MLCCLVGAIQCGQRRGWHAAVGLPGRPADCLNLVLRAHNTLQCLPHDWCALYCCKPTSAAELIKISVFLNLGACGRTGFGFAVWAIGSVGCGLAPKFWILLLCRVIMGAGEASIITLTGPFIDDVAPPAQKTLWFGVLNLVRTPTVSSLNCCTCSVCKNFSQSCVAFRIVSGLVQCLTSSHDCKMLVLCSFRPWGLRVATSLVASLVLPSGGAMPSSSRHAHL